MIYQQFFFLPVQCERFRKLTTSYHNRKNRKIWIQKTERPAAAEFNKAKYICADNGNRSPKVVCTAKERTTENERMCVWIPSRMQMRRVHAMLFQGSQEKPSD